MPANNKIEEFLQKLAPCIERGELEACVEEAARIARETGVGAEELLNLSTEAGGKGRHTTAYVLALAAAQCLDGFKKPEAYFNAGIAAQFLGKVKKAEEYYKLAIEINPILVEAHYNYAILLKELNRKSEAEEHYKLAIEENPKYVEAHTNYANLLKELDRKSEAEEHYKLAIEENPKYAEAHYNYANLLKELNRKSEAEEHYKLAIEINPKYVEAHNNYAILLKELNRKSEAEEHYKEAIKTDPKLAVAHSNYANFLREKGLLLDAEKETMIALHIDPENPYALSILGDILADEGLHLEKAEEAYQNALKNSASMKDSTISEVHNNLGWIYAQLRKYDTAKEEFQKAIRLDPLNVKARHNQRVLHKIGLGIEQEISTIQKFLAAAVSLPIIVLFISFLINNKPTDTVFAAQSTILIALLIFILLYHQIAKFKAGGIEFEKSTEQRSQYIEVTSKIER